MNDNLDDFLNSLGITEDTQEDMRHLNLAESSVSSNGDLPPEPQSLSNEDFDDILEEYGFNRPQDAEAEEVHDGSDDETEWEEGSEEEEEGVNTDSPVYAGDGIMAQIRDVPMEPMRLTVTDDGVIGSDGTLVMSRQMMDEMADQLEGGNQWTTAAPVRDLDAEEDADWDNAIAEGRIAVVEAPQEVHFHMPNGDVVDVPIIQEEAPTEVQATPPSQEPLIPLNSPTLLLDESTTRFSGAEWYNEIQRKSIIVAGCGGIGSNLAFQLARMLPSTLVLYDDDSVETVNMAGQLYARSDVGKAKVDAIADMISAYTNMQNVYAIHDRFTDHTEAGDIMMCGFDNMEARKTFFGRWLEHVEALPTEEQKNCLYLDGIIKCLSDNL